MKLEGTFLLYFTNALIKQLQIQNVFVLISKYILILIFLVPCRTPFLAIDEEQKKSDQTVGAVPICRLVRDAKSEEHEGRVPAIFPPAVLIFGLPTQKNMLKYAKLC